MASNIYQMVTDRIIEQMNAGIVPWHQPWVGGAAMAISYTTRKAYSMLNQLLLGKPGEWLTWNQIQAKGGRVNPGAKSRFCVYCQPVQKEQLDPETGEKVSDSYLLLKWYRVFHLDDTQGIESLCTTVTPGDSLPPIEQAELAIEGYLSRESSLRFFNDQPSASAYYSPSKDEVVVPMLAQYALAEEYYSTAFHELTHSTMHETRCNRQSEASITRFGDSAYSREELVAEIGSAMICNRLGIEHEKAFKNSAAYIQSWLKALKNDNRMIIWAAKKAEEAARYILGEEVSEVE